MQEPLDCATCAATYWSHYMLFGSLKGAHLKSIESVRENVTVEVFPITPAGWGVFRVSCLFRGQLLSYLEESASPPHQITLSHRTSGGSKPIHSLNYSRRACMEIQLWDPKKAFSLGFIKPILECWQRKGNYMGKQSDWMRRDYKVF